MPGGLPALPAAPSETHQLQAVLLPVIGNAKEESATRPEEVSGQAAGRPEPASGTAATVSRSRPSGNYKTHPLKVSCPRPAPRYLGVVMRVARSSGSL